MRDDPGGHVILLVAETRANRRAVALPGHGLRERLPVAPRVLLAALADGREPPGSGLIVL